ncbi:uncharacterized protein LOC111712432 isoform X3 [Eurytemora carolleeae]|uniref:uncharacterized protein LOC111712432 isoform X3 n=1 Tax=Eurytemora carolleeae TaxID=1294199 RepID=UPI000C77D089|nr:uncharacterized protein LOC111712432 isoform X3 [Eurytemora carolleeae]|eukprot:XP_023342802.1 uncharacterized protein LOC111712432 isoform X3 [Eurytemora affinis]
MICLLRKSATCSANYVTLSSYSFFLQVGSVCGVYMFLLNSDSNVIPAAFSEVQESIVERLKDLSSLKLPEFELGAEYLMPSFLGTALSVDNLREMSTKGIEIIVDTFVTASVQLSDALSTVSKSVNPVVSCAKDHVENCLATVSKFIKDTIAAVSTSGNSITEEVQVTLDHDDDVPATEQEEDNIADVLNKMTEEINKIQDNIQPDVVDEIQEVHVDALIDVAEEANVEASEKSQSNDVIVEEAPAPPTVKPTERTLVNDEIDENIRHNIVL